jgi:hypothetical protein
MRTSEVCETGDATMKLAIGKLNIVTKGKAG